MPRRPTIGVAGNGVMGSSIAALCLAHGFPTALWSRQPQVAARNRVRSILERYAPDQLGTLQRLTVSAQVESLANAQLVIETITEELAAKQDFLQTLHARLPPSVILVSNTSVLGDGVFSRLPVTRRAYTAGLHFFHPVFRMELVEVHRYAATTALTVQALVTFIDQLEHHPLVIPGISGGIVSRLLLTMIAEATYCVDLGMDPVQVDLAMRLGAHHPMGPLALADLVGLDVVLQNFRCLQVGEPDRFLPPGHCLQGLVAQGKLGKKSGEGFFRYRDAAPEGV